MTADAYLRPDRLEDALDALSAGAMTIAAGCTDLFPATQRKSLSGAVLDITAIKALRGITSDADGLTIGATTTWSDIRKADLPPAFDGLKLAAREVGARQIQNQGTIAGNLCNASPAADGVPPLLTLDAEVVLTSTAGERRLPLQDFIIGPRSISIEAGELMTAIHIPDASMEGDSHFLKLGARSSLVISIAMAAARITTHSGLITSAALAVGACGPVATRLGRAERALIGARLNGESIANAVTQAALDEELFPIDDVRADASYRLDAAAELVRRLLATMERT